MISEPYARWARAALRMALGASFLSAVGSRAGLWGAHAGHPAEAFAAFEGYVHELNPWAPASLIPALASAATALETTYGVALILGVGGRVVSLGAGGLLTLFAVAMTLFTGPQSAFDYSVWSAAAGAFVLATLPDVAPLQWKSRLIDGTASSDGSTSRSSERTTT